MISYKTEFDGETVSLEGDVIDPFLLTVLRDKRRHYRLTNIIKTIQSNQNDIIRRPLVESFVVQGCAGSGKSMIMLHRLSYLIFNNRDMSLSSVKIITPNRFFDAHINALSTELGLTEIERYSVVEYYTSLINRYTGNNIANTKVLSELNLSQELLSEIYSPNYMLECETHYHCYWQKVLEGMDEGHLRQTFQNFRLSYPDTTVHMQNTYLSLEQGIRQISAELNKYELERENAENRLKSIDVNIKSKKNLLDKAQSDLQNIRNQTLARLRMEAEAHAQSRIQMNGLVEDYRRQYSELRPQLQQAQADLEEAFGTTRLFSGDISAYTDYDSFSKLKDKCSELIRNTCGDLIDAIFGAEADYAKLPVYNFGKRRALKKQISEQKKQFTKISSDFIGAQIRESQQQHSNLSQNVKTLSDKIDNLLSILKSAEQNLRTTDVRIKAVNKCIECLAQSDILDIHVALDSTVRKECFNLLSAYDNQCSSIKQCSKDLTMLLNEKESLNNRISKMNIVNVDEAEKSYIDACLVALRKLHFNEISRNILFRDLLAVYKRHSQEYSGSNFRHKLYLRLLFCSLYYPQLLNPDRFLNIDEAQDISVVEYRLLRRVLGHRCVFNLYGDVNQAIYASKSIADWDDIAEITGDNIYVLNENYRNTLEITQFCNTELEAEVYPIGVTGEPVVQMNTRDAIRWVQTIKNTHPEYRVAVVYHHGLKAVHDLLHALLQGKIVSWDEVNDKNISVVSVELAKGLEFEAVVVIADQMSDNEKYISYTRALEQLCVVRDEFSTELIKQDDANANDEFLSSHVQV